MNDSTSAMGLKELHPAFYLWYMTIISLSILLVVSMAYVMTVLLCRILCERKRKRYTYKTSQQGNTHLQGPVYHIRSQDSDEVRNVCYPNNESGGIIPEAVSSVSSIEVNNTNQEEQINVIIHETSSTQPETRLRSGEADTQPAVEEDNGSEGEVHTSNPTFVNTSQEHLMSNSQQNIAESICDNSTCENGQTSSSVCFPPDILLQSQHNMETTAAANSATVKMNSAAINTLTFEDDSHLHDIPGFQDPELKGDDEICSGLHVTAPPNIYSSQILSTAINNQGWYEGETESYRTGIAGIGIDTESESHTYINTGLVGNNAGSSNNASSSDKHLEVKVREVDTESSQLILEGVQKGNREQNDGQSNPLTAMPADEDVVYDQPIVLHKKQSSDMAENDNDNDDIVDLKGVDPRMLFDDPGYTEGMLKQRQSQDLELPTQENTPGADLTVANSKQLLTMGQEVGKSTDEMLNTAPEMQTLLEQTGHLPGMKLSINSLSLLDYDENELNDLDPVIASCLRTPNLSDTDDEIAISKV